MTHVLGHTTPCDCENCKPPSEQVMEDAANSTDAHPMNYWEQVAAQREWESIMEIFGFGVPPKRPFGGF